MGGTLLNMHCTAQYHMQEPSPHSQQTVSVIHLPWSSPE